jgi:hypothetical protein
METVGIGKKGIPSGTSYAGNSDNPVVRKAQLLDGIVKALVYPEVAASRAPGGQILRTDIKKTRFFELCDLSRKNSSGGFHNLPRRIIAIFQWPQV